MSPMNRRSMLGLLGGAAAWPLAARAQGAKSSVIGFLTSTPPERFADGMRAFREGLHDFVIRHEGLRVYPRLVAAEHKHSYARDSIESGITASKKEVA